MRHLTKRLLSLCLAVCLCAGLLCAPAMAAGEDPERGVLNYSVAIDPQYEDASAFSEGLAAVKKDGKWGYIDYEANTVIPFEYDLAYVFNEGLAVVGKQVNAFEGEDWQTGEMVTWYTYELGFIDQENNFTYFIDPYAYDPETGEPLDNVPLRRDYRSTADVDASRYYFYNGYICLPAYDNPDDYIYGVDGKVESFGREYLGGYGWQVAEGYAITGSYAAWGGGQRYLNIATGEFLTIPYDSELYAYPSLRPFNQGVAPVWLVDYEENSVLGFINTSGQWVIQPQYHSYWRYGIYDSHEVFGELGLAMVTNAEGLYGAIDKAGNVVIPFQYENLVPYHFGLAAFQQGGLYGYLDAQGGVAIQPQYQQATSFCSDGYAVAYDGANAFLIDTEGNPIPGADNLDPTAYFKTSSDGSITITTPGQYVVIEEGGKYGFGKVDYLPELPDPSEMNSWAYEEVSAAIEENLVPNYLQNLYLNNINRNEFCDLVIQAIEEVLGQEIEEVVLAQSGKELSDWQKEYPFMDSTSSNVIAAYALGIVSGRGNGVFDPYMTITRQEAAAFLMRSAKVLGMDVSNVTSAGFADSGDVGVWFTDAVNFVYQINVMGGTGDNNFSPLGSYTREQSYMTIYRLFQAIVGQQ